MEPLEPVEIMAEHIRNYGPSYEGVRLDHKDGALFLDAWVVIQTYAALKQHVERGEYDWEKFHARAFGLAKKRKKRAHLAHIKQKA